MSDTTDTPRERKPLGLKRSIDAGEVKQTFSHGRTNKVVVEVKRRRILGKPGEAPAPTPAPEPVVEVALPYRGIPRGDRVEHLLRHAAQFGLVAFVGRIGSRERGGAQQDRGDAGLEPCLFHFATSEAGGCRCGSGTMRILA